MGMATKNGLKIGATAPDFKNLPGTDGQHYSLSNFADKKVLVVIFSCNHCPYVQAYEDRIMAIQKDFKDHGVQVVAINSNDATTHPDDSFEQMIARAGSRKFNFVYVRDESQDVARDYQASHTPHVYAFNQDRKLIYTGKIDDNWQSPDQVKVRYLREAIESALQGRDPVEAETFAIGCTIKWKN